MAEASQDWPPLPFAAWKDTCATLHMWTQIIGKIRLGLAPWTNHSWHVTLYVTARGLTTSPIPYGSRVFEIRFDFIDHTLRILTAEGEIKKIALEPRPIANFYRSVMDAMNELRLPIEINTTPNEIVDGIPFEQDQTHREYDAGQADRFGLALVHKVRVSS